MNVIVCPQCSGPHTLEHCPRWRMPSQLSPAMCDAVAPKWTLSPHAMYADLLQAMGRQVSPPVPPQTDLAKRLLDMVNETGGPIKAVTVLKADLTAICCEANRYYRGMVGWKKAAEENNVLRQPDFAAVENKRMSEMTPEQQQDALELWLRRQYEWFGMADGEAGTHIKFLLDRLDGARQLAVNLAGFQREELQDVLEGMETEDQTVDVGECHIESTAGYVCRLLRALLSAPPVVKIGD